MVRVTEPAQLADELLEIYFDADPVSATLYGIRDRDDQLPELSAESERLIRERTSSVRDRALGVDTSALGLEDKLTVAVLVQQADALIDQIDSRSVEYGITSSFFAPIPGLLMGLSQVTIADSAQAQDFLTRLGRIPEFVDAAAQRHRAGVSAGLLPVRHLVDAAVAHVDRCVADVDADPLLSQPMHDDDLESERRRLLLDVVYPVLRRYQDVLSSEIAPHARSADQPGLCWLPGGRDTYRRLARVHTTTDRDPRELHETGLSVMKRLRNEYSEIGERALGTSDTGEVLRQLRENPALRWETGDQMLDSARAAISRAEAAVPEWFGRLPSQQCQVQPVPAASGPGTPLAYYMPPALDGSRSGTYFANTYNAHERHRYLSEVTAFHEAVPGHHLQLTLAQELSGLPTLRRLVTITAYAEGWGLYTERLADEMGLYTDEVSRLGMVSLDSVRAARLVVDTGLHELGWTRQDAVDYMLANTTLPQLDVDAEVDRYIAYPGQALAYMVGRIEILRIRRAAQERLGEHFDIKAFHDTVLGHGSLPLSTLENLVAEA